MDDCCFLTFKTAIHAISLPDRFTYPFNYVPHQIAKIAAGELQQIIERKTDWNHDFGMHSRVNGTNVGKMFGVLVVKSSDGHIGYLGAFSGKVGNRNIHDPFVPPIFDALDENGFFRRGETEISAINSKISELENVPEYKRSKDRLRSVILQGERELAEAKQNMKLAKQRRNNRRDDAIRTLCEADYAFLCEDLKHESLKYQYDYKLLSKKWKQAIADAEINYKKFQKEIDYLKEKRKKQSADLQQKLFDQYVFLNSKNHERSLCEIFSETVFAIPPAGAGDCAAPKLLQYAFQKGYKPIAMAEFWWGQSPVSAIRRHKYFYPACRGKCFPILGFMLQGIDVDPDPVLEQNAGRKLAVVYEDKHLLVVNKPAEMLSVPGKTSAMSVYSIVKELYPDITGPAIVHRLDMSTSGLLVVARNKDVHEALQKQFLKKTVIKHYVALLDGIIDRECGDIALPMEPDIFDRPRQIVSENGGKPALTRWSVLSKINGKTLVRFEPITGRTHQLRVHAAHRKGLNTPIVGDDLYGQKADRLYLHAEYLSFIHPVSGCVVEFKIKTDFGIDT